MANPYGTYASLTQIKSAGWLNISGTTWDTDLLRLLNSASRFIDKYCDRYFYCNGTTKYYNGAGTKLFLDDDVLSITTLKVDEDGDGTYENSFLVTDYHKYPLNGFPKTKLEINPNGDYGSFGGGTLKAVEIAGVFGYGDGESATPYYDSTTDTAETLDIGETDITVASATPLAIGQTIRIESEDMYITGIASAVLTVIRGINGTTDAEHATEKAVYIYQYPGPIVESTLIQATRWWKRRESAFADIIGSPELGTISMYKGLDPDVKLLVAPYVRHRYV